MSVRDILVSWTTWSKLAGNADDDWADRLSHIYTVVILCSFSMFVLGGSYMDDRIACWMKGEYTAHMAKYAVNHCWVHNTYFVPMDEHIPRGDTGDLDITYYQYVPLILLCSALFFKVPCLLWRCFASFSGIEINKVVEMMAASHYVEDAKRDEKVAEIVCTIDRWLDANRQYHWNCFVRMRQKLGRVLFCLNRREGTFLTGLYMLTKLLFLANVVGQFFLLDAFMGGFYSYYGLEAMKTLAYEHQMKESRRFPRTTMCSFSIRSFKVDAPEKETIQCILPLNLYNEKIFLFLWFWFILVATATAINLLAWIWRQIFVKNRLTFVKRYLKMRGRLQTTTDKTLSRKFANFLRGDGVFLLQMIAKNANQLIVTDVVVGLWDRFLEKPIVKKALADNLPVNNNQGDAKASYK
ncbi:innexin unc-9-like [Dreissena polymorpha]|uniref:Innexin n=1 Tax=Dreissena polymorpha TaxID=45954 RepID=A0A9D4RP93_DREPO|nr:innexin unc-9-like [Dreissena polymorpha]XP_052267500.1 innexin unc-9-like [Dreissena polymorpha]XP_052267501.1 innexin unc-9-like [Dreissena polymorpha]XP_052267502.1 innexin unc-9-like [Dreissena polymorpha]XP_052267504.1 innexin unc-9-like [Dreissena polymorpha]KAH3874288.1 hypothetical protein DPMN_037531 [Dreissena polymorpha]